MATRRRPAATGVTGIFVVHEHLASRRHFDFRLEIGGVLASWAIPKGPSMNPADKRLAVMVEEHPLAYASYEGVIPAGYGAGPVVVWDHGTFAAHDPEPERALAAGKLGFTLCGAKLRGDFALVRLRRGAGRDWLLLKARDRHADPAWRLESALTPSRMRRLRPRLPPCARAT